LYGIIPIRFFSITIYNLLIEFPSYLTEIGLTPGGSSTAHTYIQTIHRTTQST